MITSKIISTKSTDEKRSTFVQSKESKDMIVLTLNYCEKLGIFDGVIISSGPNNKDVGRFIYNLKSDCFIEIKGKVVLKNE